MNTPSSCHQKLCINVCRSLACLLARRQTLTDHREVLPPMWMWMNVKRNISTQLSLRRIVVSLMIIYTGIYHTYQDYNSGVPSKKQVTESSNPTTTLLYTGFLLGNILTFCKISLKALTSNGFPLNYILTIWLHELHAPLLTTFILNWPGYIWTLSPRDHSINGVSHWERVLQYNVASHWLGLSSDDTCCANCLCATNV